MVPLRSNSEEYAAPQQRSPFRVAMYAKSTSAVRRSNTASERSFTGCALGIVGSFRFSLSAESGAVVMSQNCSDLV